MRAERGIEMGNIFKLGTRYSEAMGCYFTAEDGQSKPIIMGSYGIGLGRLLACIAEAHHDEHGLVWPISVAPFDVHIILLAGKSTTPGIDVRNIANILYQDLSQSGIEVLFDDRNESPGVKFNDADLIGIPIRLTVSERTLLSGSVEIKLRNDANKSLIPTDQILPVVLMHIETLKSHSDSEQTSHPVV
jgi:prolyl-tRNA synthetase